MATIIDAVQSFLGLHGLLMPATVSSPEMDDITEDFTAEQETMLAEPRKSNTNITSTTSESCHAVGTSSIDTTLQSTLMEASKGVTEGTNAKYKRCDSINLDGTPKPSHVERGTYGHAQKMRASMTYAFGRLSGLGNPTWHELDIGGGLMVGNPSISIEVSSYMCSLRRRKVQAGEVANSARAITLGNIAKTVSLQPPPQNWTIRAYQPGERVRGGSGTRSSRARYPDSATPSLLQTHQNGDIKPFHLWPFSSSEAHLCPVRALAAWLKESKVTSGYLFRKIASGDRISEANSPMSSEQFLELFRNNLLDVDIDPTPYGTHSFRRGGVPVPACREAVGHCGESASGEGGVWNLRT
ncbi:hypothetical protein DFJ58DRAFT_869142 [Suillus subalutaceus]|uniref:uncharacterized protein n=1 Tax=Suillus subalutaceus TaxID=48586 RepID=UPI001B880262|nr:uncharacterized protein DFJ58DRAFT_869142 [Suillus subalutaceus]KAG1834301.1 hypothetical protein DFJ58DRAFT_869142 [Suillus subalutaceus]